MKKLYIILTNLVFVLAISSATVLAYTNSGTYIGTFEGNDNPVQDLATVESQIEAFLGYNIDLNYYAKVDAPSTGGGTLTLTYENDNKSGTWTTTDPVSFYTVKASNSYAIYYEDPATTSGTWSTIDILNGGGRTPDLSHLSTWFLNVTVTPVPEPSTLLLSGFGLLLAAGLIKRRKC
ncbi:MAG: PEP-CTERM sorting domain-containing protein [Proteobacteria bacterium]|nr:PEP-CTERM sorting domain-containing protein [Pseudomonadota bacterium]